jgi:flagellar motor switch/type III secretory pathway protein FliN
MTDEENDDELLEEDDEDFSDDLDDDESEDDSDSDDEDLEDEEDSEEEEDDDDSENNSDEDEDDLDSDVDDEDEDEENDDEEDDFDDGDEEDSDSNGKDEEEGSGLDDDDSEETDSSEENDNSDEEENDDSDDDDSDDDEDEENDEDDLDSDEDDDKDLDEKGSAEKKSKTSDDLTGRVIVADESTDEQEESFTGPAEEPALMANDAQNEASPPTEIAAGAKADGVQATVGEKESVEGPTLSVPVVPNEPEAPRKKLDLKVFDTLEVTITFETTRKAITLGELRTIRPGYTFISENPTNSPVAIRANGRLVGYGKLVSVENNIGVQITEFI